VPGRRRRLQPRVLRYALGGTPRAVPDPLHAAQLRRGGESLDDRRRAGVDALARPVGRRIEHPLREHAGSERLIRSGRDFALAVTTPPRGGGGPASDFRAFPSTSHGCASYSLDHVETQLSGDTLEACFGVVSDVLFFVSAGSEDPIQRLDHAPPDGRVIGCT
jgi:hypothetical protein